MALTTIQALYDEARSALETGKEERAIGASEHLLESFPYYLEAYRILGESYLNRQDLAKAVEAFERVLRSDPENIPVHVGLGVTYERQGNLAAAIREFEQAFEIKPDLPELRSQVLRLYTEAWGSENARILLKKAGLGRMYVRGRRFDKAIQEFNDVLADDPKRVDIAVALAEALWRNGQEAEAAEVASDILRDYPDMLKANLILGYHLLAAGDPKGRKLWQHAQQLDPSQGVAYALFDGMLPPVEAPDTKIEAFDEAAWKAKKAEKAEKERLAREAAEQAERDRLAAEQASKAPAASWLAEVEAAPVAVGVAANADDDFLRSLLFGDFGAAPASPAPTAVAIAEPEYDVDFNLDDLGLDLQPFSLDEVDDTPSNKAPTPAPEPVVAPTKPAPEPVVASNDDFELPGDLTPFSFGDWDESSIDDIPGTGADTGKLPEQLQPFSLENFDDVQPETSSKAQDDDLALPNTLKPFSLDELSFDSIDTPSEPSMPFSRDLPSFPDTDQESGGFSWQQPRSRSRSIFGAQPEPEFNQDEEDDAGIFNRMVIKKQTQTLPPLVEPVYDPADSDDEAMNFFSNDDVDLRNYDEHDLHTADTEPAITPFSLTELGLDADEIADYNAMGNLSQPQTQVDEELEIKPFSLTELGLSDDEIALLQAGEDSALPTDPTNDESGLTPFSLNEFGFDTPATNDDQGFNFDEPSITPFSLDNLGLDPEEQALYSGEFNPAPVAEPTPKVEEEPNMTPFSLTDLGLDADEIAQFEAMNQAPAAIDDDGFDGGLQPFSLDDLGFDQEPQAYEEPVRELSDSSQPFSLNDIGLSAEEIAAIEQAGQNQSDDPIFDALLGIGQQQGYVDLTDIINQFDDPESQTEEIDRIALALHDNGIQIRDGDEVINMDEEFSGDEAEAYETEEPLENFIAGDFDQPTAEVEPEMTPFSLTDLGLSAEEIAMLNGETSEAPTEEPAPFSFDNFELEQPSAEVEPEMTPFSLTDLGLSAEEIAMLNGETSEPAAEEPAPFSFDNFELEQPATDAEPEMTPFSLTDLGLSAEEIAMLNGETSEAAAEEPAPFSFDNFELDQPATDAEPEMTPFSLTDLGLSAEEIAMLNGETSEAAAEEPAPFFFDNFELEQPATDAEPEMTPFSLTDLGLSAEEIAMLNGDTSEAATEEPAPFSFDNFELDQPATDAEPEMTPFSLTDLGLSAEEIAMLNGETSEAAAEEPAPFSFDNFELDQPATDAEPEMTPFSLTDLGLSAEEIAMLNGETSEVAAEEPAPFSFDNFELEQPSAEAEPEMTPFSLTDLGLSAEEIAMLNGETSEAAAEEPAPFSFDNFELDQPATDAEPEMTPFSLTDLGLSAEEIAMLNGETSEAAAEEPARFAFDDFEFEQPSAEAEPEMTPFSLTDLGLSAEEIAALEGTSAPEPEIEAEEPDMSPFTFDQLGLSAEEIAALEGNEAPAAEPASELEPDLTPFSLADLGLSDDEIASLQQGDDDRSLKLSEEELMGIDFALPSAEPEPEPVVEAAPAEPEMTPFSWEDLGLSDDEIAIIESPAEPVVEVTPVVVVPTPPAIVETPPAISATPTPKAEPEADNKRAPLYPVSSRPREEEQRPRAPLYNVSPRREPKPAAETPVVETSPVVAQTPTPVAVAPVASPTVTPSSGGASGDGPDFSEYYQQLEADPNNHGLRMALARMISQTASVDQALNEYKRLIKQNQLMDQVVDDLQDLIESHDDPGLLQRLHRALGDAYSKQGRWREAMDEYGWVLNKPRR
ncbi:tetratricopeptide repeat protein [Herpetosiphon sp.]|uniref:Tetratricopeptide TPR_2 repeat protein n=1 Tax=Herpetosiphon aurantiacus (strain ATCC 23779 / DSM 785 / 114-95) TaxID=316274 RepID=A9AXD4_HERA2|nr:tetratricopeptide repeat protein [Herpetosiphon sp.]ABX06854.1 Tetratricopeptide TPR_2 repeat protein [Herpetosiphon aurantiacus DSM 785]